MIQVMYKYNLAQSVKDDTFGAVVKFDRVE